MSPSRSFSAGSVSVGFRGFPEFDGLAKRAMPSKLDGYIADILDEKIPYGGNYTVFLSKFYLNLKSSHLLLTSTVLSLLISIIGFSNRYIEAECGIGQNAHPVAHHGHAVQGRLTVE